MDMERQGTFGWLVSLDVFFGGTGAGIFLVSYLLSFFKDYLPIAKIGCLVGPVLVCIGSVIIFYDLANKVRSYRMIFQLSSWMARGTWSIIIFVIFGFAFALPQYWISWTEIPVPLMAVGLIAAIAGFIVILYSGFLFGAVKRVPLWNTSALPLLFLFSSLYTGMAVLLLLEVSCQVSSSGVVHNLVIAGFILTIMQVLALAVFLGMALYRNAAAIESVCLLLRNPLFEILVTVIGVILPLVLFGYQAFTITSAVLSIIACAGVIIGGAYLRYSILKAGVHLPISSL